MCYLEYDRLLMSLSKEDRKQNGEFFMLLDQFNFIRWI